MQKEYRESMFQLYACKYTLQSKHLPKVTINNDELTLFSSLVQKCHIYSCVSQFLFYLLEQIIHVNSIKDKQWSDSTDKNIQLIISVCIYKQNISLILTT